MPYIKGGQVTNLALPTIPLPHDVCEIKMSFEYNQGPIRHQLWALDLMLKGDAYVEVNGQNILRQKDSVHLYAPGTVYVEKPAFSSVTSGRFVVFGPSKIPKLEEVMAGKPFLAFLDPAGLIAGLLEKMVSLVNYSDSKANFALCGLLMALIDYLYFAKDTKTEKIIVPFTSLSESLFVEQVNLVLQSNLEKRLTLKDIATKLHISTSTLAHRYKEEAGISPYQARTLYRLKMAKQLLKYEDLTLELIAAKVGFSSASHLSLAFKNHFGISPSKQRNLMK